MGSQCSASAPMSTVIEPVVDTSTGATGREAVEPVEPVAPVEPVGVVVVGDVAPGALVEVHALATTTAITVTIVRTPRAARRGRAGSIIGPPRRKRYPKT